MGANIAWLPLLLMAISSSVLATWAIPQNNTISELVYDVSPNATAASVSNSSSEGDELIAGDLHKAARVEEFNLSLDPSKRAVPCEAQKETISYDSVKADPTTTTTTSPINDQNYDVVDVLAESNQAAAAPAGAANVYSNSPRSGQTTRIFTTGEVNDEFWLKHLGDDFKHAIHLQVGSNNEDYNRIINQTNNGVHRVEVHHEYLPGAERPRAVHEPTYDQPPMSQAQMSFVNEASLYKPNFANRQQSSCAQAKAPYTVSTHGHTQTQAQAHVAPAQVQVYPSQAQVAPAQVQVYPTQAQAQVAPPQAQVYPAQTQAQAAPSQAQAYPSQTQAQVAPSQAQVYPAQASPSQAQVVPSQAQEQVYPSQAQTQAQVAPSQTQVYASHTVHTLPHNEHPQQHVTQHATQQLATHKQCPQKAASKPRIPLRKRYKQPIQAASSYISSSEDTLHTAQSQATPTAAKVSTCSSHSHLASQLPFKSSFNDYGSRPTRDLTYLLYKLGL